MKITIIAVGKQKDAWLIEGANEFLKRASRYAKFQVHEIEDCADSMPEDKAKRLEAERILAKIPDRAYVVALDERGKALSSPQFAKQMEHWLELGQSELVFLIGGSRGLDECVRQKAKTVLSFGPMTLPHRLARVVLLEQVFRAFKILNGEPYHK